MDTPNRNQENEKKIIFPNMETPIDTPNHLDQNEVIIPDIDIDDKCLNFNTQPDLKS